MSNLLGLTPGPTTCLASYLALLDPVFFSIEMGTGKALM